MELAMVGLGRMGLNNKPISLEFTPPYTSIKALL